MKDNFNPEDQTSMILHRYNKLAELEEKIQKDLIKRNDTLNKHKSDVAKDVSYLKEETDKLKEKVRELQKLQRNVAKHFKEIIKKDKFYRLEKRIDSQNYEELVSREEFLRMISKSKQKDLLK